MADTIGWVLYRKGMYQMAVKHLEDAVAKQPTVGRRAHLAMAYYKMGDQSKSEEMLRAALRLDPNSPDARAAQSLILPGQAKP